jgi:hypothetical protein
MAEQFRTTVSCVFWTETTDEADAIVDGINGNVPEPWNASTLVTVEYKAEGPPQAPALEEAP